MTTGDALILKNLRRLCRSRARLEITIGIDANRDRSEIERLGLPQLSARYLEHALIPAYESNGFEIEDYGILPPTEWPAMESSWAAPARPLP